MLIVKETTNISDIKAILCHPEIIDKIHSDKCNDLGSVEPPINSEYLYVGGYYSGEIIALMVYHRYNDGNECHVQVLPNKRHAYSMEFTERALLFRGKLPLYAEIPSLHKNVLDFAIKNNGKIIKTIKDGYVKNGIKYQLNILKYEGL